MSTDRIKLVYFSVTSNEIPNLSAAILDFQSRVAPVDVFARTRTQLENSEHVQKDFVAKALGADIVIVTLMSGHRSFPAWADLIKGFENLRAKGRPFPISMSSPPGAIKSPWPWCNAIPTAWMKAHGRP